jgi:hypothetical protein
MWTVAAVVEGVVLPLVMSLVGVWLISQLWIWRLNRSTFNLFDFDVDAVSDGRPEAAARGQ